MSKTVFVSIMNYESLCFAPSIHSLTYYGCIMLLSMKFFISLSVDGKFVPCSADEDLSIEGSITSFPPEKVSVH